MRRTSLFITFLLLALVASAGVALGEGAWGRLRAATGSVAVRENPDNNAVKVRVLKAGQVVRVDYESGGWVAIFDPTEKKRSESSAWGYVRMDQLRLAGPLDLPRGGNSPAASAALGRIEVAKGQTDPEKGTTEERPRAEEKPKAARVTAGQMEDGKAAAKAEDRPKHETASKHEAKAEAKAEAKSKSESKSKQEPKLAGAKGKSAKASEGAKAQAKDKPKPEAKPFGEIRVADRDLAVRSKRDKDSEFVTLLRPGQRVRVDFQGNGFYAVFDVDEKVRDIARARGFSRDKYLVPEKAAPAESPPVTPASSSKQDAAEEPKGKAQGKSSEKQADKQASKQAEKPMSKAAESAADLGTDKAGVKSDSKAGDKAKDKPKDKAPAVKPHTAPPATVPAPAPLPVPAPAPPRAAAKQAEHEPLEAIAYSLMERRADPLRPYSAPLVRVRLEVSIPPTGDALRAVVQEIAKAERHKGEELQLEVYLQGAEPTSLAFAVARFAQDGRMRDFLWRESLLRNKN
jgi:hypothetical protein